jgi:integrase/recombinase XerD
LDYREYIATLGYALSTHLSRVFCVMDFLQWLIDNELSTINEVKPAHIKTYYQQLKNRPNKTQDGVLCGGYIQHYLRSIRLFFKLLQEKSIVIKNPMSVLTFSIPKEKSRPKSVLSIAEALELYRSTETLQERAFLSLCYGCGLRSMELTAINLEDLRLAENYLIIPHGKGNRKRLIPVNQRIRNDIEQYILHERAMYLKTEQQKALFLNTSGERIRRYTFVCMLKKIIERTGNKEISKKEIRPHHLRHSIATHLLEQGVGLEQVRNFLGHRKLESTEIYTRVSQKQLKELLV